MIHRFKVCNLMCFDNIYIYVTVTNNKIYNISITAKIPLCPLEFNPSPGKQ